jgi:uncharacterized protein DUF4157
MHTRDDPDPLFATAHRPATVEAPAMVERTADAGTDARAMLELQRMAGNASVSRLVARDAATDTEDARGGRSPVLDVIGRGGGEPLAPELRSEMEGRLGADFGGVRVHHDSAASESAKAVDAHAYTVGNEVVFRSDRWDPAGSEGRRTLAHELSHVVQQANGPVTGSPAPGGIRVSSPNDDFEKAADRHADAALSGPAPAAGPDATSAAPDAASAAPSAQLEAAGGRNDDVEEEEELGAGAVQRQSNRDTANRPDAPNRPGEEEEEEEEDPGASEQPSRSAQRKAASADDMGELDEDQTEEPPKGAKPKEDELQDEEAAAPGQ